MATAPAQPNPMEMPADPAADPSAQPPEGPSSDYTIEIKVSGQSIQVGVESADQESAEMGEAGAGEENYQEVKSIGEACRLVREIFASGGQAQDTAESAGQMAAGYGE